jgi:hypothetical protein
MVLYKDNTIRLWDRAVAAIFVEKINFVLIAKFLNFYFRNHMILTVLVPKGTQVAETCYEQTGRNERWR